MRNLAAIAVGVILCSCGRNSGAPARFEPGYWEQSKQMMATENTPEGRVSGNRCITPEEAAKPVSLFEQAARNAGCELKDFTMSGGKIHGTRTCAIPGPGHMHQTGTMEGTYTATSYEMTIRNDVEADGGIHFQAETRNRGRRVGKCPS
jgi:hypothetical protein